MKQTEDQTSLATPEEKAAIIGHHKPISQYQQEVEAWTLHNFPGQQPHMPVLGMGEETGELLSLFPLIEAYGRLSHAQLKGEQGIRKTPEEIVDMKMDAVGDFFVFLFNFCNQSGLDAEQCLDRAWNEVKERDWIKFPKNGRDE